MNNPLLAPAAVLILWSLIILVVLAVCRARAFSKNRIRASDLPVGARFPDLEKEFPERARWVSHNYMHLMEQPTIFYAVIAILSFAGDVSQLSLAAAWLYVILRIAHSLWQCLVNIVAVRALLFVLSTACLWILAIRAVVITVL